MAPKQGGVQFSQYQPISSLTALHSGTWYTLVFPVTGGHWNGSQSTYHDQARRTQHGFRRDQRRMEVQIRNKGPSQASSVSTSVVRWSRAKDKCHQCQCYGSESDLCHSTPADLVMTHVAASRVRTQGQLCMLTSLILSSPVELHAEQSISNIPSHKRYINTWLPEFQITSVVKPLRLISTGNDACLRANSRLSTGEQQFCH